MSKRINIHDFVEWELEKLRRECNFTDEELDFFDLRAKNIPIETVAAQVP